MREMIKPDAGVEPLGTDQLQNMNHVLAFLEHPHLPKLPKSFQKSVILATFAFGTALPLACGGAGPARAQEPTGTPFPTPPASPTLEVATPTPAFTVTIPPAEPTGTPEPTPSVEAPIPLSLGQRLETRTFDITAENPDQKALEAYNQAMKFIEKTGWRLDSSVRLLEIASPRNSNPDEPIESAQLYLISVQVPPGAILNPGARLTIAVNPNNSQASPVLEDLSEGGTKNPAKTIRELKMLSNAGWNKVAGATPENPVGFTPEDIGRLHFAVLFDASSGKTATEIHRLIKEAQTFEEKMKLARKYIQAAVMIVVDEQGQEKQIIVASDEFLLATMNGSGPHNVENEFNKKDDILKSILEFWGVKQADAAMIDQQSQNPQAPATPTQTRTQFPTPYSSPAVLAPIETPTRPLPTSTPLPPPPTSTATETPKPSPTPTKPPATETPKPPESSATIAPATATKEPTKAPTKPSSESKYFGGKQNTYNNELSPGIVQQIDLGVSPKYPEDPRRQIISIEATNQEKLFKVTNLLFYNVWKFQTGSQSSYEEYLQLLAKGDEKASITVTYLNEKFNPIKGVAFVAVPERGIGFKYAATDNPPYVKYEIDKTSGRLVIYSSLTPENIKKYEKNSEHLSIPVSNFFTTAIILTGVDRTFILEGNIIGIQDYATKFAGFRVDQINPLLINPYLFKVTEN